MVIKKKKIDSTRIAAFFPRATPPPPYLLKWGTTFFKKMENSPHSNVYNFGVCEWILILVGLFGKRDAWGYTNYVPLGTPFP